MSPASKACPEPSRASAKNPSSPGGLRPRTIGQPEAEPIRVQAAHGLSCLLYKRLPVPQHDPWAADPEPPWQQDDLDSLDLEPDERQALGLPPERKP